MRNAGQVVKAKENSMHILLTGSTGFIGKNVLQAFLNAGYEVTALVRPETLRTNQPDKNPRLHYVSGLFYDPDVLSAIEGHLDAVVHMAAIRGAGKAKKEDYRRVNIEGTRALLDFALSKKIPRFLYLSTVGVLGTIPVELPAAPNHTPAPDGPYHLSKWEGEKRVRQAHDGRLRTLVLRPTITYGPGDTGFIPRMIRFVQKKRLFLPKANVNIHLLSVQRLARLIVQVLALDLFNGGVYHVADRQPVEIHALADLIARYAGGGYRTMPRSFFAWAARFFTLLGRADLTTGVRLLSESWYYDISQTVEDLLYEPGETFAHLKTLLENMGDGHA